MLFFFCHRGLDDSSNLDNLGVSPSLLVVSSRPGSWDTVIALATCAVSNKTLNSAYRIPSWHATILAHGLQRQTQLATHRSADEATTATTQEGVGASEVAVVRYAPNRLLRLLFLQAVAPKDMSRLMLGRRHEIIEIGNGSGNGSGIEEEIAIDVGRDLLTDAGEATTTIIRGRIELGAEGTGMNGIGLEIGPLVLEIGRGNVLGQENRLGTV